MYYCIGSNLSVSSISISQAECQVEWFVANALEHTLFNHKRVYIIRSFPEVQIIHFKKVIKRTKCIGYQLDIHLFLSG